MIFSLAVLLSLILLLVISYHLSCWNMCGSHNLGGIRSWISPFECGFLSRGLAESSFSFTYFILLVFFVVFDLEISLLLNLPFQEPLFKNMHYYAFFIVLVSFGYMVEVNKGYISWSY